VKAINGIDSLHGAFERNGRMRQQTGAPEIDKKANKKGRRWAGLSKSCVPL
jgi:hypothetical protein